MRGHVRERSKGKWYAVLSILDRDSHRAKSGGVADAVRDLGVQAIEQKKTKEHAKGQPR
jgi:hypothetical protein